MKGVTRLFEAARARISGRLLARLASIGLAVGTGVVLGLAAWLEPSPLGHSTHTQLGLGTCSVLSATGIPCPMCGATTSFTLMAHFRPLEALVNQPFASLLFCMTVAVFGVSVAEVVQPRDRWIRFSRWIEPWEGKLAVAFLGFMGLAWVYKIVLMT
jgi:hypothetical protein